MASIARISVSLGLNSAKFSRDLNKANKKAKGFYKSINKQSVKAAKGIALIGGAAAVAFIALAPSWITTTSFAKTPSPGKSSQFAHTGGAAPAVSKPGFDSRLDSTYPCSLLPPIPRNSTNRPT